jgi:hypothetical protein
MSLIIIADAGFEVYPSNRKGDAVADSNVSGVTLSSPRLKLSLPAILHALRF